MADDEALKAWYAIRVKTIHERVTVHELLRRHGVKFRHTGDREEQFSCPFHGKDESPSARVYPASPRSPSHAWCFVCRERWDVIAIWKKWSGEGKSFHGILSEIEKQYGLTTPPVPEGAYKGKDVTNTDQERLEFTRLYEACEGRLLSVRQDYKYAKDMTGYLMVGSILDKVSHQVGEGKMPFKEGMGVLRKLLQKIAERLQRVSASQAADS